MAKSIIVGSARISENGTVIGKVAGDQTGKEVKLEPYYTHRLGWVYLRPISHFLGVSLARAMTQACENDLIGYSQALDEGATGRLGVYTLLAQNPTWEIKDINIPCNCDCSGLVRACVFQATNKKVKIPNFNTSMAIKVLEQTKAFYPAKPVTSEQELRVGDILCTPSKGHIMIVCKVNL